MTRSSSRMGLGATNKLGLPNETELENVVDAVDYIAALRQANDLSTLPVGRRVVVIGGGMTAIDIAVQSKRLGAQSVTIVYRRGDENMKASAVRARTRADERRRHPHLGAAGRDRGPCGRVQRRRCSRTPASTKASSPRPARSSASRPTCCSPPSASAARPKRSDGAPIDAQGRPHRRRRRAAHQPDGRLGRRRLRVRRRRT